MSPGRSRFDADLLAEDLAALAEDLRRAEESLAEGPHPAAGLVRTARARLGVLMIHYDLLSPAGAP